MVKSGTDFREFTEIQLTVACPATGAVAEPEAAEGPAGSLAAGTRSHVGAAGQLPGKAAGAVASLPSTVAGLPGSVAGLPGRMASLALSAHKRCSKWARLAGIPALAGCSLSSEPPSSGGGAEDEQLHCLHSPRGGGENATPEGRSAALVYEAAAEASLATSLLVSRPAGGSSGGSGEVGGGAAPPLQLTVHCLRHVITSELPEDPEVAAIVQASWWDCSCSCGWSGLHALRCAAARGLAMRWRRCPLQLCLRPAAALDPSEAPAPSCLPTRPAPLVFLCLTVSFSLCSVTRQ